MILTFILTLLSCQKITCEQFNLNHETMDWHFFPDLNQRYTFYDVDSNETYFNQTHFIRSEKKEFSCHMCACYPDMESIYESSELNLKLKNIAIYESLKGNIQSTVYYNIDNLTSLLDIEHGSVVEYVDNRDYFQKFNIQNQLSITLNGQTFYNVTQFEILETGQTAIEIFWIQAEKGLIGFKINDHVWTK